jgi:hypothetical protein
MRIDRNVTQGMSLGLKQLGVEAEVQIYDWTGIDRGIAALANVTRHQEQARLVAEMLTRRYRADPSVKIIVSTHSAGTGIIVWALEQLPDDVMIDELVLLASALSPEYDLSRALRHVRNGAYSFNSELDTIVLGAGTRAFGTVDRMKVDAAGKVGFRKPANATDPEQYRKLHQFPYDADWMRFDNNGEHIGSMTRAFARSVIAPVVLGKGPPPRATTQPGPPPIATQPTG